ncbi:MAG TPA: arsenate reductase ArsC [Pyrinomonadaceae bacterium]|nr:arsenate reductase ArsC [Pyrinomonadaceae bacterium]
MSELKRVLFLCTGNSARSQMAEGLLMHTAGDRYEVASAGVAPTSIRPEAIEVMREIGIDISQQRSKPVDDFIGREFDYVITVCDNAKEQCPVFPGSAKSIHWSFDDPAIAEGDEPARLTVFRHVRDEILDRLRLFVANDQTQSPLACEMTAIPADQRQQHIAKSRDLFSQIQESRELPDGYEFRFASLPSLLTSLAEFISLEKLCCPFLRFAIEVEAEGGPVWLRLTGREGVKAFIREEIMVYWAAQSGEKSLRGCTLIRGLL